jgi:TMEM175 potassium channel family protein
VNKDRFEAFSDGVFGFAITLLVLGIVLPALKAAPTEAELRAALVSLWPNLVAYALSFGVIGIMWQNHHALYRLVARIDRTTIFLNLLLLAGTVFIPFATSTLGSYPTMHGSTFLYGVTLTYTATIYNVMLQHLIKARAFVPSVTGDMLRETLTAYRVGWVTYAIAMVLALWIPLASFAAYIAIAIYYLIPRGVDEDLDTV